MGNSPFPCVPVVLRVVGAIFSSGHPKKGCHVPSSSDPSVKGAAISVTLAGHLSVSAAETTTERGPLSARQCWYQTMVFQWLITSISVQTLVFVALQLLMS